ncbi:MAG: TetR/AcrR family transcriptional regulator [Christensenellales bacterium]|jgi:AcrR family transcriptional regulator
MSRFFTEKKIKEKTVSLLINKGYDAMRTKEIAVAAGVSEATIFKYFISKENLFNKILNEMLNEFNNMTKQNIGKLIRRDLRGRTPYYNLLADILSERLEFFLERGVFMKIVVREMHVRENVSEIFKTVYNNLAGIINVILIKGINNGEFSKRANSLKNTLAGLIIFNSVSGVKISGQELVALLQGALIKSVIDNRKAV